MSDSEDARLELARLAAEIGSWVRWFALASVLAAAFAVVLRDADATVVLVSAAIWLALYMALCRVRDLQSLRAATFVAVLPVVVAGFGLWVTGFRAHTTFEILSEFWFPLALCVPGTRLLALARRYHNRARVAG